MLDSVLCWSERFCLSHATAFCSPAKSSGPAACIFCRGFLCQDPRFRTFPPVSSISACLKLMLALSLNCGQNLRTEGQLALNWGAKAVVQTSKRASESRFPLPPSAVGS
ncbi:unnamed protein product [Effrenium voratum]|nr:unnamed protein product [Effrenium voratum]